MTSIGTLNQRKLECLLNDWLDNNWSCEYVQGMLALAGVVVVVVEKREERREVLNILCVGVGCLYHTRDYQPLLHITARAEQGGVGTVPNCLSPLPPPVLFPVIVLLPAIHPS